VTPRRMSAVICSRGSARCDRRIRTGTIGATIPRVSPACSGKIHRSVQVCNGRACSGLDGSGVRRREEEKKKGVRASYPPLEGRANADGKEAVWVASLRPILRDARLWRAPQDEESFAT